MREPGSERDRRPPPIAESLLARLLPERDRAPILGDLAEEFVRRAERGGAEEARGWYRRQVLRAALPALRRRFANGGGPASLGGRPGASGRGGALPVDRTVGVSWLDVRLGVRMLRRRPVMTAATLFALAIGIPASMVPGRAIDALEAPLPEDPGDRIRSLRYWDRSTSLPESPTYFELARWRDELRSFASLGAFRSGDYSVRSADGPATPVSGAEVTGSALAVLRAVPSLGRAIDREDERPGAPDVVVVGHELWQGRLAGDPDVVGRALEVGGVPHTVVGVMPEAFLFPGRQQIWLPLREERRTEPQQGRALEVFGRLAEDVSAEEAQSELTAWGSRIASEHPATNARRVAEVVRFGTSELRLPRGGWGSMGDSRLLRILALALLAVACTNVGLLVFAATATRFRELAIRTSLGASRRRIIGQMFVEALVLALSAGGLGLMAFHLSAERLYTAIVRSGLAALPYWLDFGVDRRMALGALLAAVASAGVAGVLPALRVTGSRIQESIRRAESGRSGLRFGGLTSGLIVADVTVAVAVVGLAIGTLDQIRRGLDADDRVGIAAHEYLAVEVSLSPDELRPDERAERVARLQTALVERLEAEPRVRRVAVADRLPRQDHLHRRIAIEGETSWRTVEGRPGASAPPLLPVARVDLEYFDALGQPILHGRAFGAADLADSASAAIVNSRFVDLRLEGRNPIGRRIRFWEGSYQAGALGERSYEIVGVVGPLGMNVFVPEQDAGVYLPARPGEIDPLRMAVRADGHPETLVPRVREVVAEVAPEAVLRSPQTLDRVRSGMWHVLLGTMACLVAIVAILVGMAATGLYAIMSFSVAERTREIGIRRSLGERTAALALRIARRSLVQIAIGAVLGIAPAMWLYRLTRLGYRAAAPTDGLHVAVVAGIAIALLIAGSACVSPTRRALAVDPAEALRSEG